MTALNTAFTVFSGIGIIISIVPLWWHLESWNVGTCMYMVWTALACLVHFVDSIIWNGNTINWAPVWCDIAVRIQIGVAVAWPACGLCIIRSVYNITAKTVQIDRRRDMIIDLSITVGIPVLQMALQYVVAGHRFNIYEDWGCGPAIWNTPLAYVLVWSWPLIIALISCCYGALSIREFLKRRKQLRDIISSHSSLTYDRYWRLIALSSADFCFTIPMALQSIIVNSLLGVHPWISWADTHSNYSRVLQVPRDLLDPHPIDVYSIEISRWAAVLCAFVFFGFFGFAGEARKNYILLASVIAKPLGWTTFAGTVETSACVRSSLHFASVHLPPGYATQQSALSSSSSVISTAEKDLQASETALNLESLKRPSPSGSPKSSYLDNTLDQV